MSKYQIHPIDFARLKTVPLAERGGKVRVEDFAAPYTKGTGVRGWVDSLPKILAAEAFRSVLGSLQQARANRRPILWGLGGHVIKCGLAPVLADLMERGYATAFSMNGSAGRQLRHSGRDRPRDESGDRMRRPGRYRNRRSSGEGSGG